MKTVFIHGPGIGRDDIFAEKIADDKIARVIRTFEAQGYMLAHECSTDYWHWRTWTCPYHTGMWVKMAILLRPYNSVG